MRYALVEENIIINIIDLHPINEEEFPNAIALNDLTAQIGDTYEDGNFYHEGIIVTRLADQFAEAEYALQIMMGGKLNGNFN